MGNELAAGVSGLRRDSAEGVCGLIGLMAWVEIEVGGGEVSLGRTRGGDLRERESAVFLVRAECSTGLVWVYTGDTTGGKAEPAAEYGLEPRDRELANAILVGVTVGVEDVDDDAEATLSQDANELREEDDGDVNF